MRLETFATKVIFQAGPWDAECPRIAAWIVWTQRGHWHANQFSAAYQRACEIVGCDISGHA